MPSNRMFPVSFLAQVKQAVVTWIFALRNFLPCIRYLFASWMWWRWWTMDVMLGCCHNSGTGRETTTATIGRIAKIETINTNYKLGFAHQLRCLCVIDITIVELVLLIYNEMIYMHSVENSINGFRSVSCNIIWHAAYIQFSIEEEKKY